MPLLPRILPLSALVARAAQTARTARMHRQTDPTARGNFQCADPLACPQLAFSYIAPEVRSAPRDALSEALSEGQVWRENCAGRRRWRTRTATGGRPVGRRAALPGRRGWPLRHADSRLTHGGTPRGVWTGGTQAQGRQEAPARHGRRRLGRRRQRQRLWPHQRQQAPGRRQRQEGRQRQGQHPARQGRVRCDRPRAPA